MISILLTNKTYQQGIDHEKLQITSKHCKETMVHKVISIKVPATALLDVIILLSTSLIGITSTEPFAVAATSCKAAVASALCSGPPTMRKNFIFDQSEA